ncbi:hypothetical protein AURDEDRAFT_127813 [Auricularia subglabra TFB-10046 SS5]|uniref:Uncharacterized protein n=1 Tax=Auricularia subglabra (strain TFB-10046 / SS5) TaxID=717982 RepID=J0D1W1_AURST|nr:hypothetical protein AURDEDRAFT_127813 [Auricularia subglabra TFB-10046 SS5]
MGQSFVLVNFDKREKHEYAKLAESFHDFAIHQLLSGHSFSLSTAAEYIASQQKKDAEYAELEASWPWRRRRPRPAAIYRRSAQTQSALLRTLPVDVISTCVAFADTLLEKVCFGLTCQDVWDIARREILQDLRAYETWAGHRIICIGDYTRLDDIPPNILNVEELATLRDLNAGNWRRGLKGKLERLDTTGSSNENTLSKKGDDDLYLTDFLNARSMTEIAWNPIYDIQQWIRNTEFDRQQFDEETKWKPTSQRDEFIWLGLVQERHNSVEAAVTVLRNLTTHEYVRGDAFLAAREEAQKSCPEFCTWEFADSLLLRISWSSDGGDWEALVGTDSHCAWAGHRFDFAPEESLPRDDDGKVLPPWKDVSETFLKELLHCSRLWRKAW